MRRHRTRMREEADQAAAGCQVAADGAAGTGGGHHASPAMAGMISHSGRHRPYLLMHTNRAASARVSGATASWITTTAAMAPAAKFRRGFPVPVLRRFARDESSSALPVGYSGTMAQDRTSVRGMPPARQQ